jgi:hypothetical protein
MAAVALSFTRFWWMLNEDSATFALASRHHRISMGKQKQGDRFAIEHAPLSLQVSSKSSSFDEGIR